MGAVDAGALRAARDAGRALVGFSIYNLEQGLGVVRAAEAEGAPVLLQAGSSAFDYAGREPLARLALGLASESDGGVGVHLDHATEFEEIDRCLELGYTSVMFDGSAHPLDENIRLTRPVVERAHAAGAWVEGELVGFAGEEDVSSDARANTLTDPAAADRFAEETGVDALAVAVGNVHGIPSKEVRLDFERLARIAERVDIPLVLHGASGLPQADLARAIDLGVAKLNVNAELRRVFRRALIDTAADPPAGDGLPALLAGTVSATEAVARETLRAFTMRTTTGTVAGGENAST